MACVKGDLEGCLDRNLITCLLALLWGQKWTLLLSSFITCMQDCRSNNLCKFCDSLICFCKNALGFRVVLPILTFLDFWLFTAFLFLCHQAEEQLVIHVWVQMGVICYIVADKYTWSACIHI